MPKLNVSLYRLVDSKTHKQLINQQGKLVHTDSYENFVFGSIIGSVRLNNAFERKMPVYERRKIGRKRSAVTGLMRPVFENVRIGSTTGWDSIKRQLNGRPVGVTDEFIDECKDLIEKGATKLYFYTLSMALGLHSWSFNGDQKPFFEKLFGVDKWLVSAREIKPDYETVNMTLKKLGKQFRVRTSDMIVQRIMRSDLW